jgi:hypothetical protein
MYIRGNRCFILSFLYGASLRSKNSGASQESIPVVAIEVAELDSFGEVLGCDRFVRA